MILEVKEALRAYVVWDHAVIYERGAMIMDGGLWLTFDVPAFVQALPGPE